MFWGVREGAVVAGQRRFHGPGASFWFAGEDGRGVQVVIGSAVMRLNAARI